jgi:uncharacterized YkwD family protein
VLNVKKFLAGFVIVFALVLIPLSTIDTRVEGTFTQVSTKKVQVTANTLRLRSGAGTDHSILKTLSKGAVLEVLGRIGDWYVVKTSNDTVGCVSATYVKSYTSSSTPSQTSGNTTTTSSANSAAMQKEMLQYVNQARASEGLAALTLDTNLSNGAYLKSKDMAVNNYFSHTSPTYGSPFNMMQNLGITYRAAGENIAKNFSVKGAHDAFMNSSGHRANIMGNQYHKVGFGFYQQGSYLYVTQWFTD